MSLLDVSLVQARKVFTRPVMEGGWCPLRGPEGSHPPATPTEEHRSVTPGLRSYHTRARPTLGAEWQSLAALHGLAAVPCA
jgi:hypothetical protein